MILVSNLTKTFGDFKAVNDLSFNVEAGEIVGFLGVNGAGKTTTMRMLTGILKPTAGSIVLKGYDLLADPINAKSITGYIPDRPYLYPKLTGQEFLEFCAGLYSIKTKVAKIKIESLLNEYKLSRWKDHLIESYSHGMRQRLATCAALVHNPNILIIDEPMVGLDPHGAKMLKTALKNYADQGMAILLSTHSLNVAEELSDRVIILNEGKILATGTIEELKSTNNLKEKNLEELFIELTANQENSHEYV